jgi:solute carrier family 25 (mitochondrial uncoupling protein), member 27|eukprot:g616.t1
MGKPKQTAGTTFLQTYVLSGVSSCAAETVTYPFDITKTRLQVAGEASSAGSGAKRGLFGTMAGIVREEGPRQLYRGLFPACLRHLVYSGIRVSAYEVLRERVFKKDEGGHFALWKGMFAGMAAGGIGQFIATPTDLVKVQMQIEGKRIARGEPPRYKGTLNAFATIAKKGGLRGLYTGWGPAVQRSMLVQMGDLTAYDAAKQMFQREFQVADGPVLHAMSSGVAGLVAATLGAPADVIKTRIMNQPMDSSGRGTTYTGIVDCFRQTVKNEGFGALYKGWLPTWMRMAPWSLTFFLSFEQLRRLAGLSSF